MFRFFIIPVRVQVRPRVNRHRLRRAFRLLLVLFLIGVVIEYWKVILVVAAVVAAGWFLVAAFRYRAAERESLARLSELAVPDFGEDQAPPPPPLLEQFTSGVRGLSAAFAEGFRKGRKQG